MRTLFINFWGGPGIGKSALAKGVSAALNFDGIENELVTEFAKDTVHQGNLQTLEKQYYVIANQTYRQWLLDGKYVSATTDSPIPLGIFYGDASDTFKQAFLEEFNSYWNYNILIKRNNEIFTQNGRIQNKEESINLDNNMKYFLIDNNIPHVIVKHEGWDTVFKLVDKIKLELKYERCLK